MLKSFFETARVVAKIGSNLNLNHQNQVKLVKIPDILCITIHMAWSRTWISDVDPSSCVTSKLWRFEFVSGSWGDGDGGGVRGTWSQIQFSVIDL